MQANKGPQSGVNAWLEEELLQQYHHDRASVDADWKNVFDHPGNGNGVSLGLTNVDTAVAAPAVIVHAPSEPALTSLKETGSEELMPLRGTAARIAENMAL